MKVAQKKKDLELEDRKRKALLLTKEMEGQTDFRVNIVPEYTKTMDNIKHAERMAEEAAELERKKSEESIDPLQEFYAADEKKQEDLAGEQEDKNEDFLLIDVFGKGNRPFKKEARVS